MLASYVWPLVKKMDLVVEGNWLLKLLLSLPCVGQVCMSWDQKVEDNWLFRLLLVLIFFLLRLVMVVGNVLKAQWLPVKDLLAMLELLLCSSTGYHGFNCQSVRQRRWWLCCL